MDWKKKLAAGAALLLIFLFAGYLYFTRLAYGTPGPAKHGLIFASRAELEKWAPKMLALREKYYAGIEEMLDPSKPFRESYDKLFRATLKNPALAPLPQELVLERTRGYLIGVLNSDEQNTMSAISRINPFRGAFSPGVSTFYGGFYYYACGGVLMTGKLLGWVTLSPGVEYYLFHPEETARLYVLVRLLGALAAFLSAALLFFWAGRSLHLATAFLSLLFFVTIPLLVPYSQMAKAHNAGMFFFFLGFFLFWRTVQEPTLLNYLLGAFVLGLSAGSIVTNLPVGITIFFVEWFRNGWSLKKVLTSKEFWLSCLLFFAVYFLSNLHIFLEYGSFQRMLLALKEYMAGYGEAYGEVRPNQWLPFLRDMFTNQLHWSVIPFLLAGIAAALRGGEPLLKISLYVAAFLFVMNLLFTRHPGVNIRILPLIALLSGAGAAFLIRERPRPIKFLAGAAVGCALFLSGAQALFYSSLLRSPDHLFQAGEWVNGNLPKGTTIGVVGGQFSQTGFPPFRFLDYRLINFPRPGTGSAVLQESRRPEYILTNNPAVRDALAGAYREEKGWLRPRRFWGIPFESQWVISGNCDFFILKREKKT